MIGSQQSEAHTDRLRGLMSAVLYFDIFHHPLTRSELKQYVHGMFLTQEEFDASVKYLLAEGFLFKHGEYLLADSRYEYVERRERGQQLTQKLWHVALQKSKLIRNFPFVEAVMITGSMSKGYMDDKADIDYLIITRPGRLWVARTLLAAYKKVFLLNSHRFFCVNYFLDENHLTLYDRNLFVATELLFCKPVFNHHLFTRLMESNAWAYQYYPSFPRNLHVEEEPMEPSFIRTISEAMLSGFAGTIAEKFFMRITRIFWNYKFRHMDRVQYARDMRNGPVESKHHPNGFRDRILNEHARRMNLFSDLLVRKTKSRLDEFSPVA